MEWPDSCPKRKLPAHENLVNKKAQPFSEQLCLSGINSYMFS